MLTAKLTLERFDKDHRLLERREQPSRSFLLQFIELLYVGSAQILTGAPYSMQDIANVARDVDSSSTTATGFRKDNLKIASVPGGATQLVNAGSVENAAADTIQNAEIQGETIGIVIGTGAVAVTPIDFALGAVINNGRAGGEMEYGGCELVNIAFADPNGTFDVRRYFTNLSGGAITVEEVGINAAGGHYVSNDWGPVFPFCIARDLTGGVAVANTELLRVTYTIQITV